MIPAAAPETGEHELLLLLCGTGHRRVERAERIADLAGQVDFERFTHLAADQLLLALTVRRLEEVCPGAAPPALRERAEREVSHGRFRATLQQTVTAWLVGLLERAGIRAVPLKGAFLAETAYGDPGLRLSADLDLLVHPGQLHAATEVLVENGYGPTTDLEWQHGLPLLHHSLPPERPELPPLDLHWRIHWYETGFSTGLLDRSEPDPLRGRRPSTRDELAALLLFYARDSFLGLRMAADMAAWWDARGSQLGELPLQPVVEAHPELRGALVGAALAAERLTGLPARRILGDRAIPDRRVELAVGLGNWDLHPERDWQTTSAAIDWLLAPAGHLRSFARRYWFQPAVAIARTYGRSPDARVRNALWRHAHGTTRSAKFGLRYARLRLSPQAGQARGGARRHPLSLRRPLARPRGA